MSDKTRKDSWEPEQDRRLAEIVIGHIKAGSTQLKAFEEAGEELGRTPSACGFRFNSVVRKQYEESLKAAKEGKDVETITPAREDNLDYNDSVEQFHPIPSSEIHYSSLTFEAFDAAESLDKLKSYVSHLESELERLQSENERLKDKAVQSEPQDDLTHLIAILDRARQSGTLNQLYNNQVG